MIECTRYKSINKGTLLGYADFYIDKWDIEIFGCALCQKDGRRWINLPSKEYIDEKTGEKRYQYSIKFRSKEKTEAFGKAAKGAIEQWCLKNNQPATNQIEEDEEVPF